MKWWRGRDYQRADEILAFTRERMVDRIVMGTHSPGPTTGSRSSRRRRSRASCAGARLADAVAAPRHLFGRSWGEASLTVKVEVAYDDAVASALARAGHEVERKAPEQRDLFGHAGALMRSVKGAIAAAHDPRSDGGAEGL